MSFLIDLSDPKDLKIKSQFKPPAPFRFPHDYTRTPSGTRLVGFLRSNGDSPDPTETAGPAGHGGIAEYTKEGELLRSTSAAVAGLEKAVRSYAFTILPEIDRFVVTSAPMMERSWADVVQIYRYSDFELLHTMPLEVGKLVNGKPVEGSQAAGFGPRLLDDGSVFLNSFGCAFYHLSDIGGDAPQLKNVFTLKTPPAKSENQIRSTCGIPVRIKNYWIQPAGYLNAVVVLDLTDPDHPKEVFRLKTPGHFVPHWLAKDGLANRLFLEPNSKLQLSDFSDL